MTGFGDTSLRLSYWFLNHKDQFKKWWVISLLAVDALLILGWGIVALVARTDGRRVEQQAAARAATSLFSAAVFADGVETLVSTPPKVLPAASKRVTLAAELKNTNVAYQAEVVRFRFVYGGVTLPTRTATILPSTRRFVFEPNVTLATGSQLATLEIVGVEWRRSRDPEIFGRLNWQVQDIVLDTSATTNAIPPTPAPRLKATINNNSLYSFRSVDVSIGLLSQQQLVAVEQLTLRDWEAFSARSIEAQWLQAVPANAEVVIIPQVNLLDPANRSRP